MEMEEKPPYTVTTSKSGGWSVGLPDLKTAMLHAAMAMREGNEDVLIRDALSRSYTPHGKNVMRFGGRVQHDLVAHASKVRSTERHAATDSAVVAMLDHGARIEDLEVISTRASLEAGSAIITTVRIRME